MFKNLILYRIQPGWQPDAARLEQALAAEPFAECSATQQKSAGWLPPRGHAHGALLETVDGQWLMRFAIETKSVPSDAIRRKVEEEAARIEAAQGRKPGKKELRDMKDDALQALLPQAFARRASHWVWIDPQARLLAIDTGSQARADDITTSLLRVAGGQANGLALALLHTATSAQTAMTAWLGDESGQTLPEGFSIERECELKASGEEPAIVRFTRHPLQIPEVRQHLREGKLPTRLALDWQGRLGFVLTQALQIKKLRYADGLFEQNPRPENRDEQFDADAALSTGELSRLLPPLIAALGGLADPGQPAPTPASTPAPSTPAPDEDPGPPF